MRTAFVPESPNQAATLCTFLVGTQRRESWRRGKLWTFFRGFFALLDRGEVWITRIEDGR